MSIPPDPCGNPALTRVAGRLTIVMLLWVALTAAAAPADGASAELPQIWSGLTLEEALQALQSHGLQLIYTSSHVRPEMRVTGEPRANDPRRILDELLRPHRLAARDSVGGRVLIVPAPPAAPPAGGPEGAAGDRQDPVLFVAPEEIDVTSSWPWIIGEELSVLTLERQDLLLLPHLGADFFRSMTLMPGTSGNVASAGFSVRGGRPDEVMVRLDGLEIFEPFHLKDFNDALSIMAPATIGRVELMTGGLPAEFGDRMSGVLDLTTVDPAWRHRTELGASVLDVHGTGSGTWNQGRRHWLAALRGGSLELPFRIADEEENPRFWDASGKLDIELRPGHSLRGNLLFSDDRLDYSELEDTAGGEALESFCTIYGNTYFWLRHQAVLGPRMVLESRVSSSHVERDRNGSEEGSDGEFVLRDERDLRVTGLGQDWDLRLGDRQTLKWGFELRSMEAAYDYLNLRALEDPLATIRDSPRVGTTRFDQRFRGEQYSVYVSDRLELGRLTMEMGFRLDESTILDDEGLSPRLSLAWAIDSRSRLRAAWGRYAQTQRLYELQVEDGELDFAAAEQAEHWSLGVEHRFGGDAGNRRPLTLRAELYRRRIDDPRVRWENLFDPVSIVPELESDRVRIAPESSLAQGLEIFLEGAGARLHWFLSYAWATTEDRIDGRDVPRAIDQPHSLTLDVGYRTRWRWDLNLALQAHTGWPTTAIGAEWVESPGGAGEIVPVLGPLHGERLPTHHRLDLRASRQWRLRRGELRFFLDVRNLANSRNVRGFDIDFEPAQDGRVEVLKEENLWGGVWPSVGISWTF